jgi:phage terminase large subunit-like protein
VVDPRWIRNPCDELAIAQGCTFDEDAGDYVVEFLAKFCKQSKDEWAGRPLEVLDWQYDVIKRLYGWKRADGTRRFRTCYVEVPKKNGKSTIVSGLSLYHLIADGVQAAECYINAYDRSQAGIIFDEAERMVRASPNLSRILDLTPSKKLIVHPESRSKLVALSADVPSKDGVSASFTVFDELHRQATPAMWNIFKYAGASRRQPLKLSITTAGVDRNSICFRQHDYTRKVEAGTIEDTTHLGVIYGVDLQEDRRDLVEVITDPETWRRVNPSLGVTIREEDFAVEVKEALESPDDLNNFLRLRLNVWTNAAARFLRRDKWDLCAGPPADPDAFLGEPCWAGLDLSSTTDITALVLVFGDEAGGFDLACKFWIPEENAELRERRDRVPYQTWARQGWITPTPGNVVDYAFVRKAIKQVGRDYQLRKLLCDPWNATQLAIQLKEEDGLPIETIRQGFLSLNSPTKELERLVLSGKLRHGNNPVLNWMADNAMVVKDAAGNLKLSKEKSVERIDGMAALVNAIAAATSDADGPSVYEERGLLVL